jgi:DNA-binding FadR family transcriptional regulator
VVRFHVDLLRASGNRARSMYVGAMTAVWADRHAVLIEGPGAADRASENEEQISDLLHAVEVKDDPAASQAMTAYLDCLRHSVEMINPQLLDEPAMWGGPRT